MQTCDDMNNVLILYDDNRLESIRALKTIEVRGERFSGLCLSIQALFQSSLVDLSWSLIQMFEFVCFGNSNVGRIHPWQQPCFCMTQCWSRLFSCQNLHSTQNQKCTVNIHFHGGIHTTCFPTCFPLTGVKYSCWNQLKPESQAWHFCLSSKCNRDRGKIFFWTQTVCL